GRNRPPRLPRRRYPRQVVPAGVCDIFPFAARRSCARVEPAAEVRRPEVSLDVSEPSTVWNCVGGRGRGDGLLRLCSAVFAIPQAIPRSADCLATTCPGKASLDDLRDHQGATAGAAGWPTEGRRQTQTPAHLNGQTKQRLEGPQMRPDVPR